MAYDEITSPISVTELNSALNTLLSEAFYQVSVVGEISGFKNTTTGHWYFDLKDQNASIPCAIWKSLQARMPRIKNGDLVIAHGQISLYAKTGKLTFSISRLELKGDGELKAIIEKRKQYYQAMGWFDPAIKKTIPEEIHKLGVVTSATGAALQDILNVTKRRAPGLDIIVFPAVVQGDGAAITIASRIRQANNFDACDVLIVGRGGGSEEDLSCFSEDEVIIAIHESNIPVISAVGHEIDFPLSDYVADLRAPTPSAAAEIVTETIFKRRTRLDSAISLIASMMMSRVIKAKSMIVPAELLSSALKNKLLKAKAQIKGTSELTAVLNGKIQKAEIAIINSQQIVESEFFSRLDKAKATLSDSLRNNEIAIDRKKQHSSARLNELKLELRHLSREKVNVAKSELVSVKREVDALSPLAILSRGYAIVTDQSGKTVKSKKKINTDEKLNVRVYDGSFTVKVEDNI